MILFKLHTVDRYGFGHLSHLLFTNTQAAEKVGRRMVKLSRIYNQMDRKAKTYEEHTNLYNRFEEKFGAAFDTDVVDFEIEPVYALTTGNLGEV